MDAIMRSPIMDFSECTPEIVSSVLEYWKEKLFLHDWVIKVTLIDELFQDDTELAGQNEFNVVLKSSLIKIRRHAEDDNPIQKNCHEQVLVHELLHCKYNWLQPPSTLEGLYFDALEHSLIEQMAKSLIMTKYNLPFKWFENF